MSKKPHVYATHIKHKNLYGYVVNGTMPFRSLYDAEEYCMRENIPIDEYHLIYDPKEAKAIALYLMPEIKRLCTVVHHDIQRLRERVGIYSERVSKYEAMHTLAGGVEAGLAKTKIREMVAKIGIMTDYATYLVKRDGELYQLTRWTENDIIGL